MQRSLAHAWAAVVTSDADSLSLLIQSYMPTCILVCLCIYTFVLFLFVCLSIPYSWLPNSLFLLDTGCLTCVCVCIDLLFFFFLSIPYIWLPNSLLQLETGILLCKTTSCRPCHPVFLPDFHHFSECAFWSWLSTGDTVLECKCWFSIMTWHVFACVFSFACVCICVFVSRCAPADRPTQ